MNEFNLCTIAETLKKSYYIRTKRDNSKYVCVNICQRRHKRHPIKLTEDVD